VERSTIVVSLDSKQQLSTRSTTKTVQYTDTTDLAHKPNVGFKPLIAMDSTVPSAAEIKGN